MCRASRRAAFDAYDRIEIPEIVPDVTRVTLHGGVCPCCAQRFRAPPPAGLAPGSPFGPNLRAFVDVSAFRPGIPFERLARLMSDLLGLEISEGALANMLEASRRRLRAPDEPDPRPAVVRHHPAIRRDQRCGSARRTGGRGSSTMATAPASSPSRAAARRVVGEFLGACGPISGCRTGFGAQMGWAPTDHQACLAHLLRDVQYAIDAGDVSFAPGLRHLLGRACRIGRDGTTRRATLRTDSARLDAPPRRLMRARRRTRRRQTAARDQESRRAPPSLRKAQRFALHRRHRWFRQHPAGHRVGHARCLRQAEGKAGDAPRREATCRAAGCSSTVLTRYR